MSKIRIKEISINDYKIKIPESVQDKSVLLLIGKNGTGKSQILEYIKSLSNEKAFYISAPYFEIEKTVLQWEKNYHKTKYQWSLKKENYILFYNHNEKRPQVKLLSAYKELETESNNSAEDEKTSTKKTNKILPKIWNLMSRTYIAPQNKNISIKFAHEKLENNIKTINKLDKIIYETLRLYVAENVALDNKFLIVKDDPNFTLDQIKEKYKNKEKLNSFNFNDLSSGEQEILKIIWYFTYYLMLDKIDIFLIDELEIMINSDIQGWLLKTLIEINSWFESKTQIIITSHSSAIIERAFSSDIALNIDDVDKSLKDCINVVDINNLKKSENKSVEVLKPTTANFFKLQETGAGLKIAKRLLGDKYLLIFIEGTDKSLDTLIYNEIISLKDMHYNDQDYKVIFHPGGSSSALKSIKANLKNTLSQLLNYNNNNIKFKTIILKDGDCQEKPNNENVLFTKKLTIELYFLQWNILEKIMSNPKTAPEYLTLDFIKSYKENLQTEEDYFDNWWITKLFIQWQKDYDANKKTKLISLSEFRNTPELYCCENKKLKWTKYILKKTFNLKYCDKNDLKINLENELKNKKLYLKIIKEFLIKYSPIVQEIEKIINHKVAND